MPTSIIGEAGKYGLDGDPDFGTATIPANGDPVETSIIATLVQRLLDFDKDLAAAVVGNYNDLDTRLANGVLRVQSVATVADLKAMPFVNDGEVCLLRDPAYTGGANGALSRVGLFVYDSSSSMAETALPGISDAYLVITPNSGVGRWINVVAGVGWQLGGIPAFLPKVTGHPQVAFNYGSGTSYTEYVAAGGGEDHVIGSVDLYTTAGRTIFADFTCRVRVTTVTLWNPSSVRLQVSVAGGAWTDVPGTFTLLGEQNEWAVVGVPGEMVAYASGSHSFRLVLRLLNAGNAVLVHDNWNGRLTSFSPT